MRVLSKLYNIIVYLSSSLIAQAFAGSFIATHIPILAVVAYLASGAHISAQAILLITLLATLIGTALAFAVMHHLLTPIGHMARGLRGYRLEGKMPAPIKTRGDDIGRLSGEIRALIDALEDRMTRLKRQASSDALTGLGNRRWLAEVVGVEISRARREQRSLSVIVFDLDHFKRINDDYGHDVGDEVLMAVAETARRVLRPYDLVARIGGEEFCAFLPETGLKEALSVAERLRKGISGLRIEPLEGRQVTASFGVHEVDLMREQFREMLRTADQYLYLAKGAGRNRVQTLEAPRATRHVGTSDSNEIRLPSS